MQNLAAICYQTAVLIGFAVNSPQKMPPFAKAFPFAQKEELSSWQKDKMRMEAYQTACRSRKKEGESNGKKTRT